MSLTKVTYSMIDNQWQANVRDFIPPGTDVGTTDCTAFIQAAIDSMATYAGGRLIVPPGEYLFTNLTISYPMAIVGEVPGVCRFFTNEPDGGIEVTTARGILFQNMGFFGSDAHTGSLIKIVSNGVQYNSGTRIQNCQFFNFFNGADFQDAGQMYISDTSFVTYRGSALFIQNTTTPDAGDGQVNNCIFSATYANQGFGIYQVSAGGLKVTNCKFLGGQRHYKADMADGVFTSILVFDGNSSEFASDTNMQFSSTNTGIMPYVVISNNQFSISDGATGIDFEPTSVDRFYSIVLDGNNLQGVGSWVGMQFQNVTNVTISPNNFSTRGSTAGTGINFLTGNSTVTLHRQNFVNITTNIVGQANVNGLANYHQPISYGSGQEFVVNITASPTNLIAQGGIRDARLVLIADGTTGGMAIGVLTSIGWTLLSSTLTSVTLAASGGFLTAQTTGGSSSRQLFLNVFLTGPSLITS